MTLRLWIGFLLTPTITLALSSLFCVRSMFRDREPAWIFCLPSTILGAAGALWFIFGDDIWMPHTWHAALGAHWLLFICAIDPVLAVALLSSLFAIDSCRRRFATMILRRQLHLQHRQQRQTLRQRRHWMNLTASSALIVLSSAMILLKLTGPYLDSGRYYDPAVAYWDTGSETFFLWPIALFGLVAGAAWLAHSLASRNQLCRRHENGTINHEKGTKS